jgi:DNA-directed RNA polymerase specialized sigma subunit
MKKKREKPKLPREVLQLVEWMLREYPDKEEELGVLDEYISEKCHAGATDAEPAGVSAKMPSSVQERILEVKEGNRHYQYLARFISRVKYAMSQLSEIELKFVDCYYWQDMTAEYVAYELNRDRRTVFYIRQRVLFRLAFMILPEVIYSSAKNFT